MIILLGGGGFLGSHVRLLLSKQPGAQSGADVAIVTHQPLRIPLTASETWISAECFEERRGERLLEMASAVIYMASASVPSSFAAEPWREVSENVAPAVRFLHRLARRNPKAKFIQISSGGTIYGNVKTSRPVTEEENVAPISAYGLGKVMIEEAVRFAGRSLQMPYNILRVANPVGIHARSGAQGLVLAALDAARSKAPLRLYGDGSNVRDYLSADDVAEAIIAAATDRAFTDTTWNVGSGIGRSNMEMLHLVAASIGRTVPFERAPSRGIDVKAIVLDCRKIEQDLGWRPRRDIAKTIREMWDARGPEIGLQFNRTGACA